ncbi:MAG: T9SS type A sorting domain-containing protein, partial [Bacteroidota bacterium]
LNSTYLTVDSITPSAGTAFSGNTATFNYKLNPTQISNWWVRYKLDSTAVLGTWLQSIASATDPLDLTPANNIDTVLTQVTGAYDPNNKLVSPDGNWNIAAVSSGLDLEYTINFQNTGTDTAFTVVITDTISPLLDLSSMEILSSSHPVNVDMMNRKVFFRFYNINLPDSNVNEPLSHGNVRYRIRPLTNCLVGDEILNTAYIYFDFNQPIITNTTQNSVVLTSGIEELNKPKFNLFPNPTKDGWLNVQSSEPMQQIWVHDISGRQIHHLEVNNATNVRLDARSWTSGLYLIKLQTAKGVYTERVVR